VALRNDAVRTTAFVSSTQLLAAILASDLAQEKTAQISAANFAPNPGTSSAMPFAVMSLNWLGRNRQIDWTRAVVDSSSVRAVFGGHRQALIPRIERSPTVNVILICDGQGIPLAVQLTGANYHDSRQALPLVDAIPALLGGRGHPRCRPDCVLGDRAYWGVPSSAGISYVQRGGANGRDGTGTVGYRRTAAAAMLLSSMMVTANSMRLGSGHRLSSQEEKDLLEHAMQDVRAAEAVAFFCYQVKKWIGSFAAALGGLAGGARHRRYACARTFPSRCGEAEL
jgi:hypothetical protein